MILCGAVEMMGVGKIFSKKFSQHPSFQLRHIKMAMSPDSPKE
jgi:hypothetical protein